MLQYLILVGNQFFYIYSQIKPALIPIDLWSSEYELKLYCFVFCGWSEFIAAVTFSRLEPEGRLVMGFRKASSATQSDQVC